MMGLNEEDEQVLAAAANHEPGCECPTCMSAYKMTQYKKGMRDAGQSHFPVGTRVKVTCWGPLLDTPANSEGTVVFNNLDEHINGSLEILIDKVGFKAFEKTLLNKQVAITWELLENFDLLDELEVMNAK